MGQLHDEKFLIRIPLDMVQLTHKDGSASPLAFDWVDLDGNRISVEIERVCSVAPLAEQRSGTVGDRYDCIINGQREYLYYTILQPRKWFKVVEVSEAVYKRYYKLPGEKSNHVH